MNIDLGFIKAIHSGLTVPTNQKMVWYNENDNVLYYYDTIQLKWIPLAVQPYKYQAGESIDKYRVVRYDVASDKVLLADKDADRDRADTIVGVALNNANTNEIVLVTDFYFIEEPTWTFDTAKKVFLGNNGELTQTQPTQGVLLEVAEAALATRMRVNLKRPIKLLGAPSNGGVNPVAGSSSIPAPIISVMQDNQGSMNIAKQIWIQWNGEYEEMFSKNVEIWAFVWSRATGSNKSKRTRRFVHQPNSIGGASVEGTKWHGGFVKRPAGFGDVRTEFPIPAAITDRRPVPFGFDPTDWFFASVTGGRLPTRKYLEVDDGYTKDNVRAFPSYKGRSIAMKFAFVIREETGEYPFTIGAMSDTVKIFWNQCGVSDIPPNDNKYFELSMNMKHSG